MVDVEYFHEERRAVFSSDKRTETYTLSRESLNSHFLTFKPSRGTVPGLLAGRFTSIEEGEKAFRYFDRTARLSQKAKQREILKGKERLNAKLHSKSGK